MPISENGCFASQNQGTTVDKEETIIDNDITSTNSGDNIGSEVTTDKVSISTGTNSNEVTIDSSNNEQSSVSDDIRLPSSTSSKPIEITESTSKAPVTVPPSVCPPNFVGFIADPERCDRFFQCVAGRAIPLYCRQGHEFDSKIAVSSCNVMFLNRYYNYVNN